jgi:hypothetical protein
MYALLFRAGEEGEGIYTSIVLLVERAIGC